MRLLNVLFLVISILSFARSNDTSLDNANKALKNNSYKEAIDIYNNILSFGYVSPDLYFNMAVASNGLGNTSDAILYLQKALQYKPRDDKAQALYQAILNDNSEIEPAAGNNILIRSIKNISSVFMPLTWLILAVFFLIPVGFYIFRNPFQSFSFSKYNLYPIVFSLLFIVFSMLGLYRNQQIFHNKTIVITSENTILKVGPDLKSPDLDTLAPGSIVYFEDNLAGWWQVRNAYGDTGWIEAGKGKKI